MGEIEVPPQRWLPRSDVGTPAYAMAHVEESRYARYEPRYLVDHVRRKRRPQQNMQLVSAKETPVVSAEETAAQLGDLRHISANDAFVWSEIRQSLALKTIWFNLALNDLRSRYRRTRLGPWWLVIGLGISMSAMSVMWSTIFGLNWREFVPYMLTGMVAWNWIANSITSACNIYSHEYSGILKFEPLPPLVHAMRFVMGNFLVHLHNMAIPLGALIVTGTIPHPSVLFWLPVSTFFVLLNGLALAIYMGMIGARLRDFSQLVASVMGPLMLLTPVMWKGDMLKEHQYLLYLNPFSYFIDMIRSPLLGFTVSPMTLVIVSVITMINIGVALFCYSRYRKILVYWL